MPFAPTPKAPGNPIRSADWNDLIGEIQRLEAAKFDKAGGSVGALTVQGGVTADSARVTGQANAGTLDVSGTATLRSTTNVGGNLLVAGSSSVGGTAAVTGAANFGSTGVFAGHVRVGGAGAPSDAIDVVGAARIGSGSNPLRITPAWSGFPDSTTNQAEISNDTVLGKTLMIVGNKSGDGTTRKVSIWDRLEVNGASCAQSFCNLSDGRLKTEVTRVPEALERLAQIRGVSFRWRDDVAVTSPGCCPTPAERPALGVIAQEVAEVFPELISTMGTDGHLAVDYSGLTAVLLEAVKQLKADNDLLHERVDALDTRVSAGSDC